MVFSCGCCGSGCAARAIASPADWPILAPLGSRIKPGCTAESRSGNRCLQIGRRRLRRKAGHRLVQRQHLLRLAAQPAQRDGALLGLLAADHRQHRHVRQAVLAHLGVDLLVGQVGPHRQPGRRQRRRHLARRSRRRPRRWSPPPPAPAPARAGSGRHSARSGCRGSARSCPGSRGAASPGGGARRPRRHIRRPAAPACTKSTCSVPHCQSRPIASRSTNSSFGP